MSAGESESESENELFEEAEIAETPYIQMAEDEFGAVSRFMALVGVDGRFMGLRWNEDSKEFYLELFLKITKETLKETFTCENSFAKVFYVRRSFEDN